MAGVADIMTMRTSDIPRFCLLAVRAGETLGLLKIFQRRTAYHAMLCSNRTLLSCYITLMLTSINSRRSAKGIMVFLYLVGHAKPPPYLYNSVNSIIPIHRAYVPYSIRIWSRLLSQVRVKPGPVPVRDAGPQCSVSLEFPDRDRVSVFVEHLGSQAS